MINKELLYKINNSTHKVKILNSISNEIEKDIVKLHSDKKILLVYDPKIPIEIINNIQKSLKIFGNKVFLLKINGRKKNKNLKSVKKIIDLFITNGFTKNSILISFGGGVLGDLCGFAAMIYLRGLFYFHIPSTMTSIVDSCIGGKTAINYKNIINSVGGYYHASVVYILKEIIETLPDREFNSGIAEIIKCGIISNKHNILKELYKNSELIKSKKFNILSRIIFKTLNTKINFFINDEKEKKSRLFLNFGHTFAHAIEMATFEIYKREVFRHGEAVAIGIMCELLYANQGNSNKKIKDIKYLFEKFDLPTCIKIKNNDKKKLHKLIVQNLFLDKKRISINPRYIEVRKNKPKISELSNYDLINEVVYKIIK